MLLFLLLVACSSEQPEDNVSVQNESDMEKETCTDGIKNQDETDIDCGGVCEKCDTGKNCIKYEDCKTGFCYENVCKEPTCDDGLKNQDETGVDCGGECEPCQDQSVEETLEYTLTDEQKTKLNEKLTQGTKSTFHVNAYPSGLEPGESYVFAHGITNTDLNSDKKTFRYKIEFKKARDTTNSPITVNESMVLDWFENNDFSDPVLGKYEQNIIPLGVTVGEYIASNKKTRTGIYYFEIVVEKDAGYTWKEYTEDEFSVRVK